MTAFDTLHYYDSILISHLLFNDTLILAFIEFTGSGLSIRELRSSLGQRLMSVPNEENMPSHSQVFPTILFKHV